MADTIEVEEEGTTVAFSFDEMLRYSGPHSPGGVALGFKVMERAFGLLGPGPLARRQILIQTAFAGPGARDACELVTRGLTDGRYIVDPALARPERGDNLTTFAFRVTYGDRSVTLLLREGFVTDEFIRLARDPNLSAEEQQRFAALKQELADQLMATNAEDAFDRD
ncbi:MAG: hypothetical protein M3179_00530 [Actinomycetota bacterium]|nr:hypothetical protein [Actinomycetota bacterium]